MAHFTSGFMLPSSRGLDKSFIAKLAFVRPFSRVNPLMALHVGLLHKAFPAESTFVLFDFHVNFFVPFEGTDGGELLVTKLARQTFELGVSLDVRR